MKHDSDLLRRSMDAAPDAWLDRLVIERVVARVRAEGAKHPTTVSQPSVEPPQPRPHREHAWQWRAWLARLVPHGLPLLLWRGGQRG
jgi:hypothetical protein